MPHLNAAQIRQWFRVSLAVSGFSEIDALVRHLWQEAVLHGKPSLPPGFLGRLLERLLGRECGTKASPPLLPLEEEILSQICRGTGFEHLEGLFILEGAPETAFVGGVLGQLLDRVPAFHDAGFLLPSRELENGLRGKGPAEETFPARALIQRTYQVALENLLAAPLSLSPDDLFEISHPHLFPKPADRIFYRRMMAAVRGIAVWATGVFTLQEESTTVVAHFGEPQVLPLGGYDSLTNRGDISSLVPSELAFIDESLPVDLFDYKWCESQLLYYKREEGAVFRIRRDVRVEIRLTEFFEHERHLGLLFGWCLILADRLLVTFCKDIVRVRFMLSGYRPSSLKEAGEFFRHYLREKGSQGRIELYLDGTEGEKPDPRRVQCWVLAPVTGAEHESATGEGAGSSRREGGRMEFPAPGSRREGPLEAFTAALLQRGAAETSLPGLRRGAGRASPGGPEKVVPLHFPQDEGFASAPAEDQERELGEIVSTTLKRMVDHAYR